VRVDLPSGEWAVLRTYDDLTQREAIALAEAQRENIKVSNELKLRGYVEDDPATWGLMDADEAEVFHRYANLAIVTMVKSWTIEDELPTLDTVLDIKVPVYNALAQPCSRAAQGLDFGADGAKDPKAPTGDSNESAPS